LERSVSDAGTLFFSASRRVTRPTPKQLDPNVNQEYTLILRAGNLHLRPEYTQSYEVGYGFHGHNFSYQVTGYCRRNDDTAIGFVKYIGDGVSLSTQENLHGDDFAGLELTADGHLGSQLSYSISGNLYRKQVNPGTLNIQGPRSGGGADAKFKLDYRPTAGDFIQLRASHTGHQSSVQGSSSAMDVVNIGYRRQLKANLTTLATVTDVFNGQRTRNTVTTSYFTGYFVRAIRGPSVYVGLNYSFGSRAKKDADLRYEQ
jgi:outer membrane receptor protein involved in Fe transport